MNLQEHYTGCRACPGIEAVQRAVQIAFDAAERLAAINLSRPLPEDFFATFNRAVLYLLWHQGFAIASRAIANPYIPLSHICRSSGLTTLADKDDGSGYNTRLLWIPPGVIAHMDFMETKLRRVRKRFLLPTAAESEPTFFLGPGGTEIDVRPTTIQLNSLNFFPFQANTGRRFMRSWLYQHSFPEEMIDTYMGHWRERQEPWGRFSTFDYSRYLAELRNAIPAALKELGFRDPRPRRIANA